MNRTDSHFDKLVEYLMDNKIKFKTPLNLKYGHHAFGRHEEGFAETKSVYYHYDDSDNTYDESGVYLVCTGKRDQNERVLSYQKFRPDWDYCFNDELAHLINIFAGIEPNDHEDCVLLENNDRKYLYEDEYADNSMYAYFPDTREVKRLGIELSDIWEVGERFDLRVSGLDLAGEADGRKFILREILKSKYDEKIKDGIRESSFMKYTRTTLPYYWQY